jgi:hypothetical protein
VVASAVAHALVLVVVLAIGPRRWERVPTAHERITYIPLYAGEPGGNREVELPSFPLPGARLGGGGQVRGDTTRRGAEPAEGPPIVISARIDTVLPPIRAGQGLRIAATPGRRGGGDTTMVEGRRGTYRLIGPSYGDGRLWVRALEAELGVVGPSVDVPTHVARVDRAIRERLKAYIDTMPRDSFALPPPPSWTTELDGRTWGIDSKWIYLGDLKIPTMLLALLPLPQGNYDQARDAANLARMREDILQAARRSENAEQFRKYVDELRRRKQEERDKEKARRDTVIP